MDVSACLDFDYIRRFYTVPRSAIINFEPRFDILAELPSVVCFPVWTSLTAPSQKQLYAPCTVLRVRGNLAFALSS